MGGRGRAVEVVSSKGCTALLTEAAASFRSSNFNLQQRPGGGCFDHELAQPFSGLVICVTGLSKETRKQVKDATEKLGGVYSPNLHPKCTHLVIQISFKSCFPHFQAPFGVCILCVLDKTYSTGELNPDSHALKHASSKNGLSLVTIGWFVDSVRRQVRLSEDLYSVKLTARNRCCHSNGIRRFTGFASSKSPSLSILFARKSMYIDPDISPEMQNKVIEAGTRDGMSFLKKWGAGCNADYVVCEGNSVQKYMGHRPSSTLVTPVWVLQTAMAGKLQRQVHMSDDLAKQVQAMLEHNQKNNLKEDTSKNAEYVSENKLNCQETQDPAKLPKNGNRSGRGVHMQTCSSPVLQAIPRNLLDSICWNISDPTSSASAYTDSFSSDASENEASIFVHAKSEASSVSSLSRPLNESEKSVLILRNRILTILFPIDKYNEMGPSSRSFFSEKGFTCLQVLDHIHNFYQENLTAEEIKVAIQTDSRHADLLRLVYSSKEVAKCGPVAYKRLDFLGNRKSLEMLKRVPGESYTAVYELLIRV